MSAQKFEIRCCPLAACEAVGADLDILAFFALLALLASKFYGNDIATVSGVSAAQFLGGARDLTLRPHLV